MWQASLVFSDATCAVSFALFAADLADLERNLPESPMKAEPIEPFPTRGRRFFATVEGTVSDAGGSVTKFS